MREPAWSPDELNARARNQVYTLLEAETYAASAEEHRHATRAALARMVEDFVPEPLATGELIKQEAACGGTCIGAAA